MNKKISVESNRNMRPGKCNLLLERLRAGAIEGGGILAISSMSSLPLMAPA